MNKNTFPRCSGVLENEVFKLKVYEKESSMATYLFIKINHSYYLNESVYLQCIRETFSGIYMKLMNELINPYNHKAINNYNINTNNINKNN